MRDNGTKIKVIRIVVLIASGVVPLALSTQRIAADCLSLTGNYRFVDSLFARDDALGV